jgi:hypothetical protein
MGSVPLRETVATARAVQAWIGARHESVAREIAQEARRRRQPGWDEAAALAALGLALRDLDAAAEEDGDLFPAPGNPLASLLQSHLTEQAASQGMVTPLASGGNEIAMEEWRDLGWMTTGPHMLTEVLFRASHRVVRPEDSTPDVIPNTARVAIVGDWGTGLYGAPKSAETIENDPEPIAVAMHLGDVYYSGTEREVRSRFLDLWPRRRKDSTINRALNGNHEMYAGGYGYFDTILRDPDFNQKSSYFALQNDHWTLIGLDTSHLGYERDHDLDAKQVEWVNDVAAQAEDRRIVLFSHHQLFSTLDSQGTKLRAKLASILQKGQVFAWYWGHEHRCILYDRNELGMYGRCVGHSGIPYIRSEMLYQPIVGQTLPYMWRQFPATENAPAARFLDGPNLWVKDRENDFAPNGHLILEFDGPSLNEKVCAPDGTVVWEAVLT